MSQPAVFKRRVQISKLACSEEGEGHYLMAWFGRCFWGSIQLPPLVWCLVVWVLSGGPHTALAQSATEFRLAPARTASPRATLFSFIDTMEKAYAAGKAGQSRESAALLHQAILYLDLSELPTRPAYYLGAEAALKLKEVLDRVELPTRDSTPDRLQALGQSRETGIILGGGGTKDPIRLWEIPGTNLRIHLIEDGPRIGEYLFTPRTVKRIDYWYRVTRDLPYRNTSTPGIYEGYAFTPGLGIAPTRLQRIPDWLLVSFGGQARWQWAALIGTIAVVVAAIWVLLSLARRMERAASPDAQRLALPKLFALGLSAWLLFAADFLTDRVFNITGDPLLFIGGMFNISRYVFTAWFGYAFAMFVVNAFIQLRGINPSSAPAQLTRLFGMAVGTAVVLLQVVNLAEAFGLPALSVIAGFGVGGLAVSLAARETLSDLLGSLVVLIERPYNVGDHISVAGEEGIVEYIGFRSTRIRPGSGLVLSIPNSTLAGGKISNYGVRSYRVSKSTLRVSDRTPAGTLESFLQKIRILLESHPSVQKNKTLVYLHALTPGSFDILIRYNLEVESYADFLAKAEKVMLEILHIASDIGVELAPTQTITTAPQQDARQEVPNQ